MHATIDQTMIHSNNSYNIKANVSNATKRRCQHRARNNERAQNNARINAESAKKALNLHAKTAQTRCFSCENLTQNQRKSHATTQTTPAHKLSRDLRHFVSSSILLKCPTFSNTRPHRFANAASCCFCLANTSSRVSSGFATRQCASTHTMPLRKAACQRLRSLLRCVGRVSTEPEKSTSTHDAGDSKLHRRRVRRLATLRSTGCLAERSATSPLPKADYSHPARRRDELGALHRRTDCVPPNPSCPSMGTCSRRLARAIGVNHALFILSFVRLTNAPSPFAPVRRCPRPRIPAAGGELRRPPCRRCSSLHCCIAAESTPTASVSTRGECGLRPPVFLLPQKHPARFARGGTTFPVKSFPEPFQKRLPDQSPKPAAAGKLYALIRHSPHSNPASLLVLQDN